MKKYFSKSNKDIRGAFLDYLKFLRLKDWFYVIGIAFLGYFYKIDKDTEEILKSLGYAE